MSGHRMGGEEQEEGMFHCYPCTYYVQSPSTSTLSHPNTTTGFHSPRQSSSLKIEAREEEDSRRFSTNTLTCYSSRGSNHHLFLHSKKFTDDEDENEDEDEDAQSHDGDEENEENAMIIHVDRRNHHVGKLKGDYYDDGEDYGLREEFGGWCWRYMSFRGSSSRAWITLQISLRVMVSLAVALLVFYLATKPPPPKVSIQVAGIRDFGLGEGVDASGVTTKILTCNCSVDVLIDNKSKFFGLHIHPPLLSISFSNFPFAISHGPELYAESHGGTILRLYVGTRNREMYGAGSTMEDFLKSNHGLPLVIHVSFTSHFRVVGNLIRPTFHHHSRCFTLIYRAYDKKRRTQAYNSTCPLTS